MMGKLEDHFTLLTDISEAEKLHMESNSLSSFINLYEDYKNEVKKKESSIKVTKKKKRKQEQAGGS